MVDARTTAIALLSGGSIALEILLVRAFGIEQFHHFAYLAINVAMLGFAAGGTLVAVVRLPDETGIGRWFRRTAIAAGTSLLAAPIGARVLSPDFTQLLWDATQAVRLVGMCLVLAIPFGATAVATLLAIHAEPRRTGTLYGASFIGAAAGSALAILILWVVSPASALALPGLLGSIGAFVAALPVRSAALLSGAVTAGALALLASRSELRVNPYKGLPQVAAYPDARRVAERLHPVGWVVAVDAPAYRDAPGLSLAYAGSFPRQTALFVDGESVGAVTHWEALEPRALLDWLPTALPYALGGEPRALVVGAGGGLEVENALAHGAKTVVVTELHPRLVDVARSLAPNRPSAFTDPRVDVAIGDARSYIARTRDRFDLIALGPSGTIGTSAAGVYALNEDFLHTVEAYATYLAHLTDQGVLAVTRWLRTPPRDDLRMVLTAAAALDRLRPDAARHGLVVARSWGTVTVLAKPSGFAPEEIERLSAWASARRFDLDWYPGRDAGAAAPINVLPEPTFTRAAAAAAASPNAAEQFARGYPFAVAPVSDARPYPHHTLTARSLPALLRAERGAWLPFAEWGYLALAATLAQALVLGTGAVLLPALLQRSGHTAGRRRIPVLLYFSAIGLGYLAAELAAIQQLQLLLGHPVYAVAAALTVLLLFSGMGSTWSDRLGESPGWIPIVLAVLLLAGAAASLDLVRALQPASFPVRALVGLVPLAFLGWFMGCPFALGVRRLCAGERRSVAWAWAANGFASVVAAPLGALVAIEAGSRALLVLAGFSYAAASVVYGRRGTTASR